MGIFIGGLYYQVGSTDYSQVANWNSISGFMFFINIAFFFLAMTPVALAFPRERPVFKEENGRLYGTFAYFMSRSIIEIFYFTIMPLIFLVAFYWMMGLASTAEQFFLFFLISVLISFSGNSLGFLLGSMIEDEMSVATANDIILLPIIVMSGYLKNLDSMPAWISWMQYITPVKYGLQAML